ncbi:hypothetical protein NL676_032945 [Syzygium grande]|nr:hypothetical protein NL676_032945 [Syzygium grande]
MGDCAVKAIVLELPKPTDIITLVLKQFKDFPNMKYINLSECEMLVLTLKGVLTMDHIFSRDQNSFDFFASLPGEDMPEWVIPVEEDFISFMASKCLYDKFLGFALCAVVKTNNETNDNLIGITLLVNGKHQPTATQKFGLMDSDHIWFRYIPSKLRGVVDFGQIEGSYAQFHLAPSSKIIKKWGFRIMCKQLDDDLEGVLQDNKIIDPAFLYEIGHDSTDSEAESSLVQTEIDLQKDLADCQMSTKKYSQIAPRRNHNPILAQGIRTKTMLTSNSVGGDECGGVVGLQLLLSECWKLANEAIRRQTSGLHRCHFQRHDCSSSIPHHRALTNLALDQYIIQDLQDLDDIAMRHGFIPLAKLALDSFEVPIGCVIVEEGHLVAARRNRTNETQN